MVETLSERQAHDNFRRLADNFKRCLTAMGYESVKVNLPLDVFENKELKTTFVIDYGETAPSSMNIRMKAKGVWTNIYTPPLEKERPEHLLPAKGAERLYGAAGEVMACERCGCIDFVKKGEEYECAVCCQGATD